MKIDNENIFIYNEIALVTIFIKGVVRMRKMILSFSLGSLMGMAVMATCKGLHSCQDEMVDLIKTKCQKLKNQMQSSIENISCNIKETIDEVKDSLESIDLEELPPKVKRTISKVKSSLGNL